VCLSVDLTDNRNPQDVTTLINLNNTRLQNFLESRKENYLFKRKVQIIKRHFKNPLHPLRMLSDLFADELDKIHKKSLKPTVAQQDGAS
jgi:hypothetical protein